MVIMDAVGWREMSNTTVSGYFVTFIGLRFWVQDLSHFSLHTVFLAGW